MKKIRILHTADIHFDTPFSGMTPNEALKSKEELKEVFEKIIQITNERKIDILLIAGDVFDNLSVNKSTLYFIKSCLEKINHVKIFISPGNHDPFNDKSFYSMIEWPDNTHIFTEKPERIILEELDTVVWGVGFDKPHINNSLLKDIQRIDGYNNVMVLHGEITTTKDSNDYNPITEEDIATSEMDYIALGHRHKFSGIKKIKNTYYSYSGCPQGRGFDELDDKGVLFIELKEKFLESEFIRTSIRNYYEKQINIDGCFGNNEVKNKIINEISKEDRENNFYKVILTGEISEDFTLNEEFLQQLLSSEFYFVKIIDKTEIKLDMNELMKGYSIKSIFAKKMYEKLQMAADEDERQRIILALKIGIQSLSGEELKISEG
ncbi:metallophosphoesterase family protein [Clostridium saccharobutylicum]|uniref:Metallophosphoesterase YhaO n=1 Tax=Clostridium saccharobutylicum DSM 13864 TaxID=1345695 RepID=U5MM56_CLOSA|nr:DNA repair exonuclease [Clostridium saccharobutylicum]AGX41608.1 metallophosphoesterase YhaO [Clostridium saccharobutylicum DSM 13864]AQR88889.1 putative metallophosphoesterase YhaO [Clostridium saccharobutylicum]AQR98788.1 putative metallophosphoesterase YhaO [Clostridium saccharobutylicum]AQS08513.1 putative metallophosphoesterase YhaO [Clostridium saccharobutylicum]AQS12778.1 putative metallophosphoesterase YhaO [Clostridium saccharobutylicum]